MTEYDHEPVRGLPGNLPAGEHIVWQAAPEWRAFMRGALFARGLALYCAALALLAVAGGHAGGAAVILGGAVVLQGLLALFAVLVARTTVYTLTNRRLVLRIGVALNTCINVPLAAIASADLRMARDGSGDIALTLAGKHRLGYAMLWPHARPFRLTPAVPMLRALADAPKLAQQLVQQLTGGTAPSLAALAPAAAPQREAPVMALQGAAA